jgi:tetratricopeptide (TPR) repeat protein
MANDTWIGQPTAEPTTATVKSGIAFYVDSPADRFVEAIEDEPQAHVRAVLATRAFRHDPGCIEAHLEMAAYLGDHDQRLAHLTKAAETGEHLWQPVVEAEGGSLDWWAVNATRPYMRTIRALGLLHHEAGDPEEARRCFEQLLEMNPSDNQGIRYLLAEMDQAIVFSM